MQKRLRVCPLTKGMVWLSSGEALSMGGGVQEEIIFVFIDKDEARFFFAFL